MKQNFAQMESGNAIFENEHTREKERKDMVISFILGVLLSLGYFFYAPADSSWLIDLSYLFFFLIVYTVTSTPGVDDKQSLKTRKTSLWLTAIMALAMWSVFIMDADSIYVHTELACFGQVIGHEVTMKSIALDYVNYGQVACIIFMVVCALISIALPLNKLFEVRNEI